MNKAFLCIIFRDFFDLRSRQTFLSRYLQGFNASCIAQKNAQFFARNNSNRCITSIWAIQRQREISQTLNGTIQAVARVTGARHLQRQRLFAMPG
jgi:hypothetical protein